jgi:hypothetical protein
MTRNRDPIYAPDGKTWYQTALDEAAKRGEFAGRIERLEALVSRMERAIKAANIYYGCYVQDEAEDIEFCISPEQHEAAKELRAALRIAVAALMARRAALAPEQDK